MSLTVIGCCAAWGVTAGAALPRAAYRLAVPWGAPSRSGCVHCGAPFPPGPPGWVRPGAACRCARPPGPSPLAPALSLGGAAGLLGWSLGARPELPAFQAAAALAVLLAFVDLGCLRLPDRLVGALAAGALLPLVVVSAVAGDPGRLVRAGAAALLSLAAYLLLAALPGRGLGFGDVKLAGALGLLLGWLGWPTVVAGLIAPHLINGPVAVALLATGRAGRRSAMPFGPALVTGALLAVALTVHPP